MDPSPPKVLPPLAVIRTALAQLSRVMTTPTSHDKYQACQDLEFAIDHLDNIFKVLLTAVGFAPPRYLRNLLAPRLPELESTNFYGIFDTENVWEMRIRYMHFQHDFAFKLEQLVKASAAAGNENLTPSVVEELARARRVMGKDLKELTGKVYSGLCPEIAGGLPPRGYIDACAVCGITKVKICRGCKNIAYCSVACQRQDWLLHKSECIVAGHPAPVTK